LRSPHPRPLPEGEGAKGIVPTNSAEDPNPRCVHTHELQVISTRRYEHGARLMDELRRQIMWTLTDCVGRSFRRQSSGRERAARRPACDPWRFLEQQTEERSLGEPEQARARQPEQQPWFSSRPVHPRGLVPCPEPVRSRTDRAWCTGVHEPVSWPRRDGGAE
jgi:hypothetical protein